MLRWSLSYSAFPVRTRQHGQVRQVHDGRYRVETCRHDLLQDGRLILWRGVGTKASRVCDEHRAAGPKTEPITRYPICQQRLLGVVEHVLHEGAPVHADDDAVLVMAHDAVPHRAKPGGVHGMPVIHRERVRNRMPVHDDDELRVPAPCHRTVDRDLRFDGLDAREMWAHVGGRPRAIYTPLGKYLKTPRHLIPDACAPTTPPADLPRAVGER